MFYRGSRMIWTCRKFSITVVKWYQGRKYRITAVKWYQGRKCSITAVKWYQGRKYRITAVKWYQGRKRRITAVMRATVSLTFKESRRIKGNLFADLSPNEIFPSFFTMFELTLVWKHRRCLNSTFLSFQHCTSIIDLAWSLATNSSSYGNRFQQETNKIIYY